MNPERELDHVVLPVSDLDLAARIFRKRGFTVSPRAYHGDEIGTANHLIVFENNYLELIGIVRETPQNQHFRNILATGETRPMLALRSSDIVQTRAELIKAGLQPSAALNFSRKSLICGDKEVDVAFSIATLPLQADRVTIFFCQHHMPENTFHPSLQNHENAAQDIHEICIETSAGHKTAERIAGLVSAPISEDGGDLLIKAGRTRYLLRQSDQCKNEKIADVRFGVHGHKGLQSLLGKD